MDLHSLKDVLDSKSLSQTSPIFLRSLACQLILFVLVYSFMRLYLFEGKKKKHVGTLVCTYVPTPPALCLSTPQCRDKKVI